MWWLRRNPRASEFWAQGETLAARYLRRKGMKILARNVRCGRNEVDIIARDGADTVVFVEVRTRRRDDPVPPEDTVNPVKQLHIRAAANWYIAKHYDPDTYYRFDIVAVVLPERGQPEITHFPNAF